MKVLERDIQKSIIDWLSTLPRTRAFRRNVAGTRKFVAENGKDYFVQLGKKGMADIWGVCNAIHFEVEVKRPGKEPTTQQSEWLTNLASVGAVCFVADNLDELMAQWPWELFGLKPQQEKRNGD